MKKHITLLTVIIFTICSVYGQSNTTYGTNTGSGGSYNSFYGYYSGYMNYTGSDNVFIGYGSGSENSSGNGNVFIGNIVAEWNYNGSNNSMVGNGSGTNNYSGSNNAFLGVDTGYNNSTGSYNTFLGSSSGEYNSSGTYNTYLGAKSGYNNSTGQRNVYLGCYAGYNASGNDKLYIDNSSTPTPLIYGDFLQNELTVNGDLGIGITNPQAKLHVNGMVMNPAFKLSDSFGDLQMKRTASGDTQYRRALVPGYNSSTGDSDLTINYGGDFSNGVRIQGTKLTVDGTVGIGTTDTKGFKLGVQGNIAAEEVQVQMYANWPDFIFEPSYNLPTLKEVEQHIKDNGHLKDIPSAKEVAENGIFLGDMNAKLLQKIEELTLYTIEQEKKIESQKEQLENQSKTNKALENRLLKIEQLLYGNVAEKETKANE